MVSENMDGLHGLYIPCLSASRGVTSARAPGAVSEEDFAEVLASAAGSACGELRISRGATADEVQSALVLSRAGNTPHTAMDDHVMHATAL